MDTSLSPRAGKEVGNGTVSITEGAIWKSLLVFFYPILIGTLFQQLYNTADAVIVGRFVSKEALAAVGGGTAVYITLIVGFFTGISSGAGIVVAQFFGAGNERETSRSVHTALVLAAAGGAVMSVAGFAASPWVLDVTHTPREITGMSLKYLRIYFTSMIPMFLYNMGAGILRAEGDSKKPLYVLIAAVVSNILLDLLFVVVFAWGVAGAAWATVICQIESMVLVLWLLSRKKSAVRFSPRKFVCTPHILVKMLRLGLSAGIQSTFYGLSNIIIQSAVNSFGTTTVAAWAAYGKIDAVFWTLISSLGVAVTTFSGQNYGAKKYSRIKKCTSEAMLLALAFTALCSVFFWFTGRTMFALFTTDGAVVEEGMKILRFLAPIWFTYISIEILSGVIRGTGKAVIPTLITLFGVCAIRVLWLFLAVPLRRDMLTVVASYPITWTVTSAAFWIYWLSGKWLGGKNAPAQS